jgi:hypothetical protein
MECHKQPFSKGEHSKIWRADDLGDLELLDARYITYSFAKAIDGSDQILEAHQRHFQIRRQGDLTIINEGSVSAPRKNSDPRPASAIRQQLASCQPAQCGVLLDHARNTMAYGVRSTIVMFEQMLVYGSAKAT